MLEQDLQSRIKTDLKKKGWIVIKTILLSENGFPDLICFRNKETIFIEVKSEKGTSSPLQKYRHKKLIEQGFKCLVINSYQSYLESL